MRRDLAADNPHPLHPDLATSLNNLGASLRGLGEYHEALTIDREAVALRRHLAADNPTRHTPDLATSLSNLGASLRALR